MAKPSTSKPRKSIAAKSTSAAPAKPKDGDTDREAPKEVSAAVIERIRRGWPAPSEVQRQAFKSQFDDAHCEELGSKTKAELVRREARAWIVNIDRAKRSPGGVAIRYSGARLAYLVELSDELAARIAAQKAEQGTAFDVKAAATAAAETARAVLSDLQDALRDVAGERKADKGELDNALPDLKAPEDVAARLEALAQLAARWRGRKDPVFQVLVEEHGLTEALIARARKAAATLADARTGARGTRLDARDAPPVNRVEGRVLAEMKVAMRAFDSARRTDKTIPALVPGRGTRAALIGRAGKPAAKSKDETPPSEGGAAAPKRRGADPK